MNGFNPSLDLWEKVFMTKTLRSSIKCPSKGKEKIIIMNWPNSKLTDTENTVKRVVLVIEKVIIYE